MLLCYVGPPQAISNLTTKPVTQSSSNALILSWSAPSSPVQLHYTVTVRLTNTKTSTTTITMFNTSSTTITISRDNITGNSTECDIYTFSVTAINLAGSSLPANTITPVSFVPSGLLFTDSTSSTCLTLYPLPHQLQSVVHSMYRRIQTIHC